MANYAGDVIETQAGLDAWSALCSAVFINIPFYLSVTLSGKFPPIYQPAKDTPLTLADL